jgi:hypothetical protein
MTSWLSKLLALHIDANTDASDINILVQGLAVWSLYHQTSLGLYLIIIVLKQPNIQVINQLGITATQISCTLQIQGGLSDQLKRDSVI